MTHSDRDASERSLNRFTSPQETTGDTPAPQDTSLTFSCAYCGHGTANPLGVCGPCMVAQSEHWAAPAGPPLHESADRDADNVPSDRLTTYAEAIRREDAWALFHPIARACVAVEERHTAELRAEIARVRGEIDAWKTVVENDTSIQGSMRRTISRVAKVRDDWQAGHEPVHHRGYIADLDRALRGPEPTEATSNEDAPGLDVGADAPTPVGPEPTEECIDDSDICEDCGTRHACLCEGAEPTDAP